ncbi:hypothetical protein [Streptosporangium sp. NPDC002721]|uniref:hypothetical protein n=1 Tax=Streptosporangium sp. NPDC002721 TaxID=3366188 RepID=UPI0036A3C501
MTRQQAAAIKGVTAKTIDRWVRVGYLAPIPGSQPGLRLFKLDDVDDAETRAYEAALATSGSDKRVTRAA